ncbi:MAG: hypothetical protein M3R02_12885 [Chloroflexota bacterium]|nr:hypothetical protein [Chloroflexota bacterium]
MIVQQSSPAMSLDLEINVVPPRTDPSGHVLAASVSVWPFGRSTHGIGYMWGMSPAEARQMGDALLAAAKEAEELFGDESTG